MSRREFFIKAQRNIARNNFNECMQTLEVNREIEVHKTVVVLSLILDIRNIMETDGPIYEALKTFLITETAR